MSDLQDLLSDLSSHLQEMDEPSLEESRALLERVEFAIGQLEAQEAIVSERIKRQIGPRAVSMGLNLFMVDLTLGGNTLHPPEGLIVALVVDARNIVDDGTVALRLGYFTGSEYRAFRPEVSLPGDASEVDIEYMTQVYATTEVSAWGYVEADGVVMRKREVMSLEVPGDD